MDYSIRVVFEEQVLFEEQVGKIELGDQQKDMVVALPST